MADDPPAVPAAGAPAAGAKRGRDSPGPQPQAKRSKASAPAPKKRKDQTGAQHLRVLKKSIPDAARTLVAALYLHIRILLGIIAPAAVPSLPSDGDVAAFDQRYRSMDEILVLRNNPNVRTPSNDEMIQHLVELRADHGGAGTRAKQAGRVPESALHFVLGQLARYGLRSWRPNFNEDAYSLYNSTHRLVALDTFRQLVVGLAYDHMAVDKSFLDQMLLLTQVYDHYVHYRLFKIWEREQKYPGAAQAEMERDTILARRRQTAEDRGAFLKLRHYPDWVVALVSNPEATSDNEDGLAKIQGEVVAVFWIREREERADLYTRFVRWIDETRKKVKRKRTRRGPVQSIKSSTGAAERLRIVCPRRKLSEEPLPTGIALDWFNIAAFNKLDYSFRALFADEPTIAMPDNFEMLTAEPDDPKHEDSVQWRMLTQQQWMEQFGEERLKKYRIPDPAGQGVRAGPAAGSGGGGGGGGGNGGGGGSGGGGGGGGGGRGDWEPVDEIEVDKDLVSEQERFAATAKRKLGKTQPGAQDAAVPPKTGVPGRLALGKGKGKGKGKESAAPKSGGAPPSGIPRRAAASGSGSASRFSAGSGPASGSGTQGAAAGGGRPSTGNTGNSRPPRKPAAGGGSASGAGTGDIEIIEVVDLDVEMVDELV
ncbi:hypothetical protein AURDEDRAFT_131253 [Auricularia subglabra TFB-10046 SS5]|uniref:Uncharacterized protein n=1 Tax=Auricularia subglabra (strain TFB-10046 / SS5) TaxID=717982 RepID=J0LCM4_AURST|nr:hypothetical protein AURDEDRAFT_131253 [Auricularia subglabra TFB-10046 SS5]